MKRASAITINRSSCGSRGVILSALAAASGLNPRTDWMLLEIVQQIPNSVIYKTINLKVWAMVSHQYGDFVISDGSSGTVHDQSEGV